MEDIDCLRAGDRIIDREGDILVVTAESEDGTWIPTTWNGTPDLTHKDEIVRVVIETAAIGS